MRRYEGCGLPNVWLLNGYAEADTPYGRGVKYVDVAGLHRTIALAVVDKPGPLTAAEFRFLRKEMLLSQKSLARMLGTTEQAVARWERGLNAVPGSSDRLLRVLYRQHAEGKADVRALVDRLNELDAKEQQQLRFEHYDAGWKAAA